MTYTDRALTIAATLDLVEQDIATLAAAADAEVASLTAALTAAKAQNLTDAATIRALEARIAELTAVTPPPVDPPPVVTPPTTTRRVRYAPPTLTNPLTIDLTPTNRKAIIPVDRDAIVRIPAALGDVAGGIEILGGRNVRLIGGQITYTGAVQVTRALYLKGTAGATQPRNIHIEGLLIDGGTINGDAIDIDCQGVPTTVTLANVDIALTLTGSFTGNHSDAVQTWNGPNALRVDGLVVRNPRYQGFMLDPRKFNTAIGPTSVELHNVHIVQDPAEYGYAFFDASIDTQTGSNVKVRGNGTRSGYPAAAWPFVESYTGTPLPDEQFLSGKPGMGYVSPGYL